LIALPEPRPILHELAQQFQTILAFQPIELLPGRERVSGPEPSRHRVGH
jgi:hypothetical protein